MNKAQAAEMLGKTKSNIEFTIKRGWISKDSAEGYLCAINLAIEALKAQTPEKVVSDDVEYRGITYMTAYRCPHCNRLVDYVVDGTFAHNDRPDYCSCGQALDWSDVSEKE